MDLSKGFGYSKITDSSEVSEQTDLFDPVTIEKGILGGRTQVFRPLSENNEGPFQFNLESQGPSQYLKLNSIRLGGKCRIVKNDGSNIDNGEDLSICNLFPQSLFKSVEPEFNNILVTDLASPLSHYQAYIQTLLSYTPDAQFTQLQGQMFIPDEAGKFDNNSLDPEKITAYSFEDKQLLTTNLYRSRRSIEDPPGDSSGNNAGSGGTSGDQSKPTESKPSENISREKRGIKTVTLSPSHFTADLINLSISTDFEDYKNRSKKLLSLDRVNSGYTLRNEFIKNSRTFDFYIPPTCDILQSDRLLHPSISLRLKFTRSSDAFSILSPENDQYRIEIEDLKLYARYISINPNIINSHAEQIEKKNPLIYPVNRTLMKSYNIPEGETSTYISRMFSGILPKSVVIGFVNSRAFHGTQKLNPWNFKHYDVSNCSVKMNGENVPLEPYTPNFRDDNYIRDYCEFYRNIGIDVNENCGNIVTPDMYKGGCFFSAYDLSGDQCNMLHRHETQTGNIDFQCLFRTPLPESVTVIVYASLEADIEIGEKGPVVKYK